MSYAPRLKTKYRCYQHPHPGYNLEDAHTDRYLIEMAKIKSRIPNTIKTFRANVSWMSKPLIIISIK